MSELPKVQLTISLKCLASTLCKCHPFDNQGRKVTWHLLGSTMGNNHVLYSFLFKAGVTLSNREMWNNAISGVKLTKACELLILGYALGDDGDGSGVS